MLLTLSETNVSGEDEKHFNKPADIAFGPDREIYIADRKMFYSLPMAEPTAH